VFCVDRCYRVFVENRVEDRDYFFAVFPFPGYQVTLVVASPDQEIVLVFWLECVYHSCGRG